MEHQRFHVRNIFRLVVPLQAESLPTVDLNSTVENFGFTISFPNNPLPWHYRVNMYSDYRRGHGPNPASPTELTFTCLLQWAKKTPFTFLRVSNNSSIEAIELHLRIGPGFDFRKIPQRYVRFEIECFVSGTFQDKCSSKLCQLLSKRRSMYSSGLQKQVDAIPLVWQDSNLPSVEFDAEELQLQCISGHEGGPFSASSESRSSPESSSSYSNHPHKHAGITDLQLLLAPTELESSIPLDIQLGQDISPENSLDHEMASESERYVVLYNGNAEVIGNFRALNFYKASDINIKEDIRLLVDDPDDDPRSVLLQIDGVSYKFKPGTLHSTKRRFVGYIAQQIESVVPSAVQLIDGILHVDYESLIPYLSESIKQNFHDINDTKSEQHRIKVIVDMLFDDFIQRSGAEKNKSGAHSTPLASRESTSRISTVLRIVTFVLLGTLCTVLAVIGLYFVGQKYLASDDFQAPAPVTPHPPDEIERQALIDLFMATNGDSWSHNYVFSNSRWLSPGSFCYWLGVSCEDNHVVGIFLVGNNLQGIIPESIGKLTALKTLVLSQNSITGTIPKSISNMRKLKIVELGENKITGTIPELIGTIEALETLNLSQNNLTGTIPAAIAKLKKLTILNLSANNQLSGTLPDLPESIKVTLLGRCNFTGTIPPSFSLLVFYVLDISVNQLSGTLPPLQTDYFGSISMARNFWEGTLKARSLDVSFNLLTGTLTKRLAVIQELILNDNLFTGELRTDTLSVAKLYLNNNQFTSFHSSGPMSPSLRDCNAGNNPFKCPIPIWLSQNCSATCIWKN